MAVHTGLAPAVLLDLDPLMFNEIVLYTRQKVGDDGPFNDHTLRRRTSTQPNGYTPVSSTERAGSGTFVDPLFPE